MINFSKIKAYKVTTVSPFEIPAASCLTLAVLEFRPYGNTRSSLQKTCVLLMIFCIIMRKQIMSYFTSCIGCIRNTRVDIKMKGFAYTWKRNFTASSVKNPANLVKISQFFLRIISLIIIKIQDMIESFLRFFHFLTVKLLDVN